MGYGLLATAHGSWLLTCSWLINCPWHSNGQWRMAMAPGYLLLAIGFWLLSIGYWLLIGYSLYWLLAIGQAMSVGRCLLPMPMPDGSSCLHFNFASRFIFNRPYVAGIYAVGDVSRKSWQLTPVAIAAGRRLADRLFNNDKEAKLEYSCIPTVSILHSFGLCSSLIGRFLTSPDGLCGSNGREGP